MCWMQVVPAVGLEPTTFALQERCYYQLSYAGKRRLVGVGAAVLPQPGDRPGHALRPAVTPLRRCRAIAACYDRAPPVHACCPDHSCLSSALLTEMTEAVR